ncbi:uncharacterized protein LOC127115344 isoform X2 [Lathyrus oleraceus]|uniref:uncharacterized protein LOC127115344 isoform X2 n=1 Tax=Pisum sativum TaxID=3888 RepID=UPI0021CF60D4|nr:uncharacterized protein LOC127115344 isoform X2 [Pisum sativum]
MIKHIFGNHLRRMLEEFPLTYTLLGLSSDASRQLKGSSQKAPKNKVTPSATSGISVSKHQGIGELSLKSRLVKKHRRSRSFAATKGSRFPSVISQKIQSLCPDICYCTRVTPRCRDVGVVKQKGK